MDLSMDKNGEYQVESMEKKDSAKQKDEKSGKVIVGERFRRTSNRDLVRLAYTTERDPGI
jgi:hypothetical protein